MQELPMLVYVVRHAWAEDRDSIEYPDDSRRPLTAEGMQRFRKVVKSLQNAEFQPQVIATSPYVRCRETAEIIQQAMTPRPEVFELEALAPGSNLNRLVEWTRGQSHPSVAWVGHAPDVEILTAALIGKPSTRLRFSKGAIAAVEFYGAVTPAEGELRWFVTAKVLGC